VAVEEGLDVVASFLGTGDALQPALQLVRAPVEPVGTGAAGRPRSLRSPDPLSGPPEHRSADRHRHHDQHEQRQRTDHRRTIACRGARGGPPGGGSMSDSIYRVTEVIGTSATSWEDAAKNAVETAARTLRDLRVGEIVRLDVTIEDGRVTSYRARVNISFKYETGG
jgi:dodecin